MEIEGAQIPRVLDDRDVVVGINNNFAAQAGLDQKNRVSLLKIKILLM
jgi:D-methionine transport system substrate-binding protein